MQPHVDVAVVGAGAAGLAAARALARAGASVVLFEARNRVGGRVRSVDIADIDAPAELGAEFVHGRADATMALLHESGSGTLEIGEDAWYAGEDGVLHFDEEDFIGSATIFNAASSLDRDVTVDEYLQPYLDDPSTRAVAEMAREFVMGFDAADPAAASTRAIAQEFTSGTDTQNTRPQGSYRGLISHLFEGARSAGVRIELSTPVRRIAWRRGMVQIDSRCDARVAIVTVPAATLPQIAFDPPLPEEKRAALERIATGPVVKVVLGFRTRFWERIADGRYADAAFFQTDEGAFPVYWTQAPQRNGLVVAWAGGPRAEPLLGFTEREKVEAALRGFGGLFGAVELARAELAGAATHDWSADPFARGAYTYVLVGGEGARGQLAAPLDRTLFFAGEATSTGGQGGTVSGALESGLRAAREVAAELRIEITV